MKWELVSISALILILFSGCAGNGNPVDTPTNPAQSPSIQTSSPAQDPHRVFWGLWDVSIAPDLSGVEIIPDRSGAMHLNTVRLLEVEPCTSCPVSYTHLTLPTN